MKVRIEVLAHIPECEVVIRCGQADASVQKLRKDILDILSETSVLVCYKQEKECFIPYGKILFFETETDNVYVHTADDVYRVKLRLYELEQILPQNFARISKSTILNISHILSIQRSLTSASLIQLHKSHKKVYVSRFYYKNLKQRLDERRNYEN